MDYFVHNSWRALQKLFMFCGVWPYQKLVEKYCIQIIYHFFMISILIPALSLWRPSLGTSHAILLENTIGSIMVEITVTQQCMLFIYNKQILKILEKVNYHFETIKREQEAFVLNKFSENAKTFCDKYIAFLGMTVTILYCLPIGRMLFEYQFKDGEFRRILPYEADYGPLAADKYYCIRLLHLLGASITWLATTYAYEYSLMVTIRHACSLFEIVKMRLKEASELFEEFEWDTLDFATADNKACEFITSAIDLHNEALEMMSLTEEAYSHSLLFTLVQNMLIFSGGIYIVFLNLNNPFEFFRYSLAFTATMIHFYVLFSQGQIIIDSSSSVFDTCYNLKWYFASKKTRILLSIMMLRSSRPCKITGGDFFILSMETYSKMLKIGMSYFSVLNK